MKNSFISLIFLIFLSIKPSSQDTHTFEMDEENKVTGTYAFIETSNFQKGKEMLIVIKAKTFSESNIYY